MPFTRIVILGGGPIGLFCALEAAEQFIPSGGVVALVEMRSDYSRLNVPTLTKPILTHIKKLGVYPAAIGASQSQAAPLSQIEKALYEKAAASSVQMYRGWAAIDLVGRDQHSDGRFKGIAITLAKCGAVAGTFTQERTIVNCDLLVLAVGAGGIEKDLFKLTLGFKQKTLPAQSFALYGVYNRGPRLLEQLDVVPMKKIINRLGGQTNIPTTQSEYLLLTLKDVSPSDFNRLKANVAELRRCMDAIGAGYNTVLLGTLNENAKAVGAFEVKIKRAGHSLSPNYPALLIGDAAVSPHPQTGSGIGTGFHGFEAFQVLLTALKTLNQSSDAAMQALWTFEESYEIYIAAKAIEGTVVTLSHLISLAQGYEDNCVQQLAVAAANSPVIPLMQTNRNAAMVVRQRMQEQWNRAVLFGCLLGDDVARIDTNANRPGGPRKLQDLSLELAGQKSKATGTIQANDSIDRLWNDIGSTYNQLTEMTQSYAPLEQAIRTIEAEMRKKGLKPA